MLCCTVNIKYNGAGLQNPDPAFPNKISEFLRNRGAGSEYAIFKELSAFLGTRDECTIYNYGTTIR